MYGIAGRWLHRSLLLLVAAAPLAGCDDETSPTGPAGRVPLPAPATMTARAPELGSCQHLAPDAGSELVAKARSVILLRSPRETPTAPAGAATTIRV